MVTWNQKNVLITGGTGFLGTHLSNRLEALGADVIRMNSKNYDLRLSDATQRMFMSVGKVDYIFNLAANVGGIGYNQNNPYALYYDNLLINLNMIDHALHYTKGKFIQIGTVCSYPKYTPVPFNVKNFWEGYPEETNAPYGIAKKVSHLQLQLAREEFGFNGIYIVPTNLYGPGDNFTTGKSHVIPALIRKFVEAKSFNLFSVEVWGTGLASRDFLYVDDAVEGIILAAENYNDDKILNLGSGTEYPIFSIVEYLIELTGYKGQIIWDKTKPDGQPRRQLSIMETKIDWKPRISIQDGLRKTLEWYRKEELIAA